MTFYPGVFAALATTHLLIFFIVFGGRQIWKPLGSVLLKQIVFRELFPHPRQDHAAKADFLSPPAMVDHIDSDRPAVLFWQFPHVLLERLWSKEIVDVATDKQFRLEWGRHRLK